MQVLSLINQVWEGRYQKSFYNQLKTLTIEVCVRNVLIRISPQKTNHERRRSEQENRPLWWWNLLESGELWQCGLLFMAHRVFLVALVVTVDCAMNGCVGQAWRRCTRAIWFAEKWKSCVCSLPHFRQRLHYDGCQKSKRTVA